MNTLDKYPELSVATCGDPTGMGASGSVIEAETTDKSTATKSTDIIPATKTPHHR